MVQRPAPGRISGSCGAGDLGGIPLRAEQGVEVSLDVQAVDGAVAVHVGVPNQARAADLAQQDADKGRYVGKRHRPVGHDGAIDGDFVSSKHWIERHVDT